MNGLQERIEQSFKAWEQARKRAEEIEVPSVTHLNQELEVERSKIKECEAWEQTAKRFKVLSEKESQVIHTEKRYYGLDKLYKYFAYGLPKTLIERCKLPIDGVEFKDDTLFIDGRRVDLLSESQKAMVATKLATSIAKAKGHLAISLDGIEIMDKEHRQEWLKIARDSGLKVLYTRLGTPEEPEEREILEGKIKEA